METGDVAQRVKGYAAKLNTQSSIPRTNMKKKNQFPQIVL